MHPCVCAGDREKRVICFSEVLDICKCKCKETRTRACGLVYVWSIERERVNGWEIVLDASVCVRACARVRAWTLFSMQFSYCNNIVYSVYNIV